MDFGVFYTCFTEKNAVEHSLDVLYSIYPDVRVYLVSDGGSDYKYLENKFKNIETHLESDTRGPIPTFAHRPDYHTTEVQKLAFDAVMTFLDRTKRAIEYSNKEFLLVMEPDVLVRGKLSNVDKHKLLGSRINYGMEGSLRQILKEFPGAIDVNNWGVTPAIFECESFVRLYNTVKNDEDVIKKLCNSDRRFANYDFMFAVLFGLIGIPETFNPEIVECFRNHFWETSGHPLIHQYRAKYPLSNEGYVGTHVVNKHGLGDAWHWSR